MINLNQLKDLLGIAFDAGWHGFKETKEDCIEKIIEEYLKNKEDITISASLENNSNYYSYYCSAPYNLSISTNNEIL